MSPMPRLGRKASTLLLIALVTLAATLTVLSPALAQGAAPEGTSAGEPVPADAIARKHTIRSIETGCPEGKDPCWDLVTFPVLPGDWVELTVDLTSGGFHNVNIGAPIDVATPIESAVVQKATFQVPENFKADGVIEFICDNHPTTMVASFVGPAALTAAGGEHEDVPEMGVHFLAYWVGVIAFALLFIVYGATFFLFKYNETSATTDHLDRSKGEGARLETRNALILAVLFAVVATAALIYVLS